MLELVSWVCCIVLLVMIPTQMRKIRAGWQPPKFKGDRAAFLASHRKQLTGLFRIGCVLSGLSVVRAVVTMMTRDDDGTTQSAPLIVGLGLVGIGLWLGVAVMARASRGQLDALAAAEARRATAIGAPPPGVAAA